MVNPFDRNFFKFFLGFVCILALSFLVLYLVGQWGSDIDSRAALLGR
jgi:hypothetical protein